MHDCRREIALVKKGLPEDGVICDLADLFKVFGDSTRLKILSCLSMDELCVQDITALLGVGQSAVSHQLRTLRECRLVTSRREGKLMLYSLADDHVRSIIRTGYEHLCEGEEG